jgi:Clp amino terminal domain, pathogenicity island component
MMRRRPTRSAMRVGPVAAVLFAARDEAEQARHGYIGVEHVLIALALPGAPVTRGLLAEQDITLDRARAAVRLVLGSGRGDGPGHDAATLLATLGVDLDEIRREVRRQFGPDAIDRLSQSEIGKNLRRGPLCGLPSAPALKKAVSTLLEGSGQRFSPTRLHERLLRAALEVNSPGLTAVLAELDVPAHRLRAVVSANLRLAS